MTIRTIIYSIALFALTSCEQLGSVNDITPEYVLTDKNVFVDANSTEAFVDGLYQHWRSDGITQMRNCMSLLTRTQIIHLYQKHMNLKSMMLVHVHH